MGWNTQWTVRYTGFVTGDGVLRFPKIEIERKPQKIFQTIFIKLMLQHKGGGTEERHSTQGLALLGCVYELGRLSLPAVLLAHYPHPRKVTVSETLVKCTGGPVVSTSARAGAQVLMWSHFCPHSPRDFILLILKGLGLKVSSSVTTSCWARALSLYLGGIKFSRCLFQREGLGPSMSGMGWKPVWPPA